MEIKKINFNDPVKCTIELICGQQFHWKKTFYLVEAMRYNMNKKVFIALHAIINPVNIVQMLTVVILSALLKLDYHLLTIDARPLWKMTYMLTLYSSCLETKSMIGPMYITHLLSDFFFTINLKKSWNIDMKEVHHSSLEKNSSVKDDDNDNFEEQDDEEDDGQPL